MGPPQNLWVEGIAGWKEYGLLMRALSAIPPENGPDCSVARSLVGPGTTKRVD